ncbi:lipoprotein [Falsiruegeria mediterranea]|uniref:Type IV secretion system putative lipoprotein virB7 n=1 Tax=Falsiruegeria mediterranea M17 TaxID=1200281 RepID=A0A2R8CF97_9RHOB|nr:hypothetical protein [Falsiruegeria mediterranea]SPJ31080.1 hypothetical protein TRM7615_04620 [Falsiruegeria mediterranea M17]
MKKIIFIALIPALVAACASPIRSIPAGVQSQKSACVSGNYDACSEIGHAVRDAEGGTTAQTQQQNFVLSQPIVD